MSQINELAETCLAWLWHSGWQAAIVAVIVFAVLKIGRDRISSQLRYAMLLIVLLKFATPPFLGLPTGFFSQRFFAQRFATEDSTPGGDRAVALATPTAFAVERRSASGGDSNTSVVPLEVVATEEHSAISGIADQPSALGDSVRNISANNRPTNKILANNIPVTAKPAWMLCMFVLYLLGIATCLFQLCVGYWSIRRLVAKASLQMVGPVYDQLIQTVRDLEMSRTPELRISDELDGPFVVGVMNPVVVMPAHLSRQLTPEQLRVVIAHELIHIRRQDLVAGWLEVLLRAFWWFHPAMWWLKPALRQIREDCCDDALIASKLAQPERYCETLIVAAASPTAPPLESLEPLALGFANREHPAGRRIRRLMDDSIFRSDRIRVSAIVVTLLLSLVTLPGTRLDQVSQATEPATFAPAQSKPPQSDSAPEPIAEATKPKTKTPKRISGKVVNVTGQPIAGATVQMRLSSHSRSGPRQYEKLAEAELVTGDDGSFSVDIEKTAPQNHSLSFHAFVESKKCFQRSFSRRDSFFVHDEIELEPFELARGIRVKGRIVAPVSAAEKPADAYVSLYARFNSQEQSESIYQSIACDREGYFEYVVPENCELKIDVMATNYASVSKTFPVEPTGVIGQKEIEIKDLGEIQLKQGVSVFGTARHRDGRPAVGVVFGMVEGDPTDPSDVSSAKTDSQGRFRLPPHTGKCTLLSLKECRARKITGTFQGGLKSDPGFPLFDSLELILDGKNAPELEVELVEAETVTLSGVIRDEQDKPVPGVAVWCGWYGDSGLIEVATPFSDAQGRYSCRVPKGRVPSVVVHDQHTNEDWFQPYLAQSTLNAHADLFEHRVSRPASDVKFKPAVASVNDLDWKMIRYRSRPYLLRKADSFVRWWFFGE